MAIAFLVMATERAPDALEEGFTLDVAGCVAVDEAAVRDLIQLELRDVRAPDSLLPIAVTVRCTDDGAQVIRVQAGVALGDEGGRIVHLLAPEATDPASREARARELALAIAELIRRLEIAPPSPAAQSPAATSASPAVPAAAATAPLPVPEPSRARWQLGILSSFESFAGGQGLIGGDLTVAVSLGHWALGELRAGGRRADGATLPYGSLRARAATAAAGVGLNLCASCSLARLALMFRVQGDAVELVVRSTDLGDERSKVMGVLFAAVEPRLAVRVARHISLVAASAAGIVLHGIVVRAEGAPAPSLTGFVLSANLGAVLTF